MIKNKKSIPKEVYLSEYKIMKKIDIEKIEKAEKTLNNILLKIIIWFSFLADSKDDISKFLKKQAVQIYNHLLEQYQKAKEYYKAFKTRHKEYSNKKIK